MARGDKAQIGRSFYISRKGCGSFPMRSNVFRDGGNPIAFAMSWRNRGCQQQVIPTVKLRRPPPFQGSLRARPDGQDARFLLYIQPGLFLWPTNFTRRRQHALYKLLCQ